MTLGLMILKLSEGMTTSFFIFSLTLVFSLPLGLGVALIRMSQNHVLSSLTRGYISVMRGTPLMLQLLVVYFSPYYLFRIRLSPDYRFWAVIIAFVMNYAAYFAEIYRGGIEAVPRGQYEAAKILGYTKSQAFIRIILPQVVKTILPSVTNEIITLIKDTSIAFAIAVSEMFTVAKAIASSEKTMVSYAIAGLFYYVFNFIVAAVMERLEKKLNFIR